MISREDGYLRIRHVNFSLGNMSAYSLVLFNPFSFRDVDMEVRSRLILDILGVPKPPVIFFLPEIASDVPTTILRIRKFHEAFLVTED